MTKTTFEFLVSTMNEIHIWIGFNTVVVVVAVVVVDEMNLQYIGWACNKRRGILMDYCNIFVQIEDGLLLCLFYLCSFFTFVAVQLDCCSVFN